jgi:hypothetical protein
MKSRIFVREEVIDAIERYLSKKPEQIFPESFADIIADDYTRLLKMRGRGTYITGYSYIEYLFKHYRSDYFSDKVAGYGKYQNTGPSFISDKLLFSFGKDLIRNLNTHFIRACYCNRDIYFKVYSLKNGLSTVSFYHGSEKIEKSPNYWKWNSWRYSHNFDWFPLIRSFVEKRADIIDTVTISWDFESTGREDFFVDSDNRAYDKMPVRDFLTSPHSCLSAE